MSQEFDVFRCEASGGRPVPEVSWWNQTNKVHVRGHRYSLISLILPYYWVEQLANCVVDL